LGYSNQITANSTTAQQLGEGISTARLTVEVLSGTAYVLGVNDDSTPSAADVVASGNQLTVGGQPLVLEDPQYVDLSTYWVATDDGEADVRMTG